MKAVILAAGEGKRLYPLTSSRSKHMIPIAGKPILEHLLLSIKDAGINDVLIVTGYYEKLVKNYFGRGSKFGLKLTYIHQKNRLGTAHAIGLAENYIEEPRFLVIYGDLIVDSSILKSILKKHKIRKIPCMCVVPVDAPQQYGVIALEDDRVVGILEKPSSEAYGNLVNAGIYVFTKDIFKKIKDTPKSLRGEKEITSTIQTMINNDYKIFSNKIRIDDWLDVGRPWDILKANKRILTKYDFDIKGEVEEGVYINGNIHLEEGARIRSGAYIEGPVFIGSKSDVGPNCYIRPFTCLDKKVRIGNCCEIKNSLILKGTYIAHQSYVADSIIGANCNFGAGTITANLRFDSRNIKIRIDEKSIDSRRKKLGVIMGDNVKTGVGTRFMPGVKIENDSWIGPCVTVYKDVPSKTFLVQKQELKYQKIKFKSKKENKLLL